MEKYIYQINRIENHDFSPQVLYVTLYQLWYAQGYQEFEGIESSVTTKVISSNRIF